MRRAAAVGSITACLATASSPVALQDLWPHPTGATWTYDRVRIEWGTPGAARTATTVRFQLGDSTTVGAGVPVQLLLVTTTGVSVAAMPALLAQLAVARPDAAARPGPAAGTGSSGLVVHDAALLRVADEEIAAYRADLGIRSWLYLEPDVAPGHAFGMQLVPDLADSVFLQGTVVGPVDVSTPAGSFAGALRVRYVVDYGWSDVTDASGNVLGRTRAATRGEVFYATGVGPVLARETFVPQVETTGDPPPPPADSTFAELRLQAWSLHPTAVARLPWSEVKRRYR